MDRERLLRRALWATTGFNLIGAFAAACPGSWVGRIVGFPPDAPLAYRAFVALFILSFAGVYLWLAQQPRINRELLGFMAIGKASAFALALALGLLGAMPPLGVFAFSGDLAFAALFFWYLSTTATPRT